MNTIPLEYIYTDQNSKLVKRSPRPFISHAGPTVTHTELEEAIFTAFGVRCVIRKKGSAPISAISKEILSRWKANIHTVADLFDFMKSVTGNAGITCIDGYGLSVPGEAIMLEHVRLTYGCNNRFK